MKEFHGYYILSPEEERRHGELASFWVGGSLLALSAIVFVGWQIGVVIGWLT